MIGRFLSFLSLLAFGGALGFSWGVMGDKPQPMVYALIGALLAALVWMLKGDAAQRVISLATSGARCRR